MSRINVSLLVSIFAVAIFGFSACSASAFEWWVNGASLNGKKESIALTVQTPIEIATANVPLKCKGATSTNAVLQSKIELNWTALKLETCTVPGKEAECTVKGGEVKIALAEGLLELNALITMVHIEKTAFITFTIEGAACGIKNSYTMEGTFRLKLREPEVETNPKIFAVLESAGALTLEPGNEKSTKFEGELKATAAAHNWKIENVAVRC